MNWWVELPKESTALMAIATKGHANWMMLTSMKYKYHQDRDKISVIL